MKKDYFHFIYDPILKGNLRIVFYHISELAMILYSGANITKSSFRKTIIIYIASIVEAILLFLLKEKNCNNKIEIKKDNWIYENVKKIYKLDDEQDVIGAIRRKNIETKSCDKLNFDEINKACLRQKIISKNVFGKADKIRKMRNGLHIGGLQEIQKDYSNADLDIAFDAMNEVIILAQKIKNDNLKHSR
jgi:hypothetical protein